MMMSPVTDNDADCIRSSPGGKGLGGPRYSPITDEDDLKRRLVEVEAKGRRAENLRMKRKQAQELRESKQKERQRQQLGTTTTSPKKFDIIGESLRSQAQHTVEDSKPEKTTVFVEKKQSSIQIKHEEEVVVLHESVVCNTSHPAKLTSSDPYEEERR